MIYSLVYVASICLFPLHISICFGKQTKAILLVAQSSTSSRSATTQEKVSQSVLLLWGQWKANLLHFSAIERAKWHCLLSSICLRLVDNYACSCTYVHQLFVDLVQSQSCFDHLFRIRWFSPLFLSLCFVSTELYCLAMARPVSRQVRQLSDSPVWRQPSTSFYVAPLLPSLCLIHCVLYFDATTH